MIPPSFCHFSLSISIFYRLFVYVYNNTPSPFRYIISLYQIYFPLFIVSLSQFASFYRLYFSVWHSLSPFRYIISLYQFSSVYTYILRIAKHTIRLRINNILYAIITPGPLERTFDPMKDLTPVHCSGLSLKN